MALIPVDAGLRLKLQSESELVQPLRPAHPLPADLPEFAPGQTFTARIQEALPGNTFRALVAGRQLTLELPEGAKPGDELELVVVDRSPKVIIARRVEGGAAESGSASIYPWLRMSHAARLIGELLPPAGRQAEPAPLLRGEPLLPAPPASGAAAQTVAPLLQQAVSRSGVFYEAHQLQWLRGERPLADLLAEPQGRLSPAVAHGATTSTPAATLSALPLATGHGEENTPPANATTSVGNAETNHRLSMASVPDSLRPIVSQQLEALASQRLVWHGEFWLGLPASWEIDWREDGRGGEEAAAPDEREWRTRLALTLPRLGAIEASLALSGQNARLILTASRAQLAVLQAALPELALAFAAVGLKLAATQLAPYHGEG